MVTVGISTVGVGVGVDVGILVAVGVGVSVAVGVRVGVWVDVGVRVTVGVSVGNRLKTDGAVGALLGLFLLTAVPIPRTNMTPAAAARSPHLVLYLLSMLFRYFPWDGLCLAPALGSRALLSVRTNA